MGALQYIPFGFKAQYKGKPGDIPLTLQSRLLHLKGMRQVPVVQVVKSAESINSADAFVLQQSTWSGPVVIVWNGTRASPVEKIASKKLCNLMSQCTYRGGNAKVIVADEGSDSEPQFWAALGLDGATKPAGKEESDGEHEQAVAAATARWTLSRASGRPIFIADAKLAVRPLRQEMLSFKTAIYMWTEVDGLIVWIPKGFDSENEKDAVVQAYRFIAREKVSCGRQSVRTGETSSQAVLRMCLLALSD